MALPNESYLLRHVPETQENPRLDTQHKRITHGIMKGRLVHESIPLGDLDGPVADICCGTGVWLNDLSMELAKLSSPKNTNREFVGFDSNAFAFGGSEDLAPNVSLIQHDCTTPFASSYLGKFALVNLRGLAFAIPKGKFTALLRHAVSLTLDWFILGPGGYLQWLDTEPQLWSSMPESKSFIEALDIVSQERSMKELVAYMPDFMIQEYIAINNDSLAPESTANPRSLLSLKHFSLTPGGAARSGKSHESDLNTAFSDTVAETLQLLLQGYLSRMQSINAKPTNPSSVNVQGLWLQDLIEFIAEVRRSNQLTVFGSFPLLVARKRL